MEFYPFMVYILTHELIHVARFCQNLHPFDCDQESLQKEEEKVNQLTRQVLNIKKSKTFDKISSLYHWASSVRSVSRQLKANFFTLRKSATPQIFNRKIVYTKLHSKADRGADEESTSRSMTRRQQRYANEGDLVLLGIFFYPGKKLCRAGKNRKSDDFRQLVTVEFMHTFFEFLKEIPSGIK